MANRHGAQLVNGPNPEKIIKTGMLYTAGFLGTALFIPDAFREIANTLIVIGFTAYLHDIGKKRRPVSNAIARDTEGFLASLSRQKKHQPEKAFSLARASLQVSAENTLYNVLNGGAHVFDQKAPRILKETVEESVNELARLTRHSR